MCDCSNSFGDFDQLFSTKLNKLVPKKESGLGEIISPILTKPYVRLLWKKSSLKNKDNKTKNPFLLEVMNRGKYVNIETKFEYFSKFFGLLKKKLVWIITMTVSCPHPNVLNIIKQHKSHPSIENFKGKYNSVQFRISVYNVRKVIWELKSNKAAC